MAHFAKIEDGIVTNIVVVDNNHESNGEAYLNSLGLEGTWVQTSYNANFGKKFAAIGDTYDSITGNFIPKKIYAKWLWDENAWAWIPPTPYPASENQDDTNIYEWDDLAGEWKIVNP